MKNKIIFLVVFLIPVLLKANDIENYLNNLTPFNIDEIADSLNNNFQIKELVLYLKSNNPLINRCVKKTIAKFDNFPVFFIQYDFKNIKISYKIIQIWHFYIKNYPNYKIKDSVVNKFYNLCSINSNIIKSSCADVLKYFNNKKIINLLCLLLDENDIKIKIFAINSLSYLKNKDCMNKIKKLNNEKNPYLTFTISQYFINIKK